MQCHRCPPAVRYNQSCCNIVQRQHFNTSVFSFLRQLTTRHCSHLLLNAVLRLLPSIDISCPQGPEQQTHCSSMHHLIDGTDRQTPYHYTDPTAYYMSSFYCISFNFTQNHRAMAELRELWQLRPVTFVIIIKNGLTMFK